MSERRDVIARDGYRVRYAVHGSGPPVVLLPNLFQSAAWFERTGFVDALATTNQVVVVDPLGHGDSDAPTDPRAYTMDACVDHVVDVVEAAGIGRACFWGYGRAADVALLVTRRRPDLAAGLIYGGLVLDDWRVDLRADGIDIEGWLEDTAKALDDGDWDSYFRTRRYELSVDVRDEITAGHRPEVVAAMVRAESSRPVGFVMPQVPTLAYWAEQDPAHPRNIDRVELLPVHWAVVPGDHLGAAYGVEAAMAVVRPFLDSLVTV